MNQYIALLRGINVNGHKKIIMTELKAHCQKIGFQNVSTYIQSGNIIFTSDKNKDCLSKLLKDKIKQEYAFDVPVFIMSREALATAFQSNPFEHIDIASAGNKVLISFLHKRPDESKTVLLHNFLKPSEKLVIKENYVYLHCPLGQGKSRLSNNFIENKLAVSSTTRNLKTIAKLLALTKGFIIENQTT